MGHLDDWQTELTLHLQQLLLDPMTILAIKSGEGFVQQQQARATGQGLAETGPLSLTPGNFPWPFVV